MTMNAAPVPLHALPAGYGLHEYSIDSVLGIGGFGITYLARDTHLDMRVAIKEYLPSSLSVRSADSIVHPKSDADAATYRWGLDRFLKEAQTLARFRHPNIVRVIRYFEANGTAYMVMDYEDGQSLAAYLRGHPKAATEAFLRKLLTPLLDGLKQVHLQGFMHRDIKPTNVFVRVDGSPVLLDFGSARLSVTSRQAQNLTAVYTAGYAPFEQYFSDGKQGPWTDIYSLGAILYWCVTGDRPVDAARRVKSDTLIPAVRAAEGDYSERFLAAIDQALILDEERRPQSIETWEAMFRLDPDAAPEPPPAVSTYPAGAVTREARAAAGPTRVSATRGRSLDPVATGLGVARQRPRFSGMVAGVVLLAFAVVVAAFIGGGFSTKRRMAEPSPASPMATAVPSTAPTASPQDERPSAPEEAVSACAGRGDGETCTFVDRDQVSQSGSCVPEVEGGRRFLMCRPSRKGNNDAGGESAGESARDVLPRDRPLLPPPEAIAACQGKAIGSACEFPDRRNQTLSGTCFIPPGAGGGNGLRAGAAAEGSIACRPNRRPGPGAAPVSPSSG